MAAVPEDRKGVRGLFAVIIWTGLLAAAFYAQTVVRPAWAGVISLAGWPALVAALVGFWAVVAVFAHREWRRHTDLLESIPVRIHVDGSRGKTGTCRLVGAALAANGMRVLVKTTGKIPALIDASGKDSVINRSGLHAANLREQKDIIALAAEQHAQAIVIECMAVDPELRRVSERSMIRATIAVITNVRRDHLEVIGPDLGTAARNLAEVIPQGGTVVTAEERLLPVIRKEAERRGARIVSVDPHTVSDGLLDSFPYITFRENVALAIAVSDLLGLDRNRSVQGMLHSTPDFGTVRLFERTNDAGPYTVVCALGVNDVDSLMSLQAELVRRGKVNGGPLVGLFNSRDDRAVRSLEFARAMGRDLDFGSVIVTGRHTKAFVRAAVRNGFPRERLSPMESASPREILEALDALTPAGGTAFACGNMVTDAGYGIVEELSGRGPVGRHAGS